MSDDLVLVSLDDHGVATVTLNRPEAMNAMSKDLNGRLEQIAAELNHDPRVRVVVIRGALPPEGKGPAFSAGADLKERKGLDGNSQPLYVGAIRAAVLAWFGIQKPTIASVHGWCLGGGFELALTCDWIISSFSQRPLIGFPEVDLAIMPGAGGTQLLLRRISAVKAFQLIALGKDFLLRPQEAKDWGLIDMVVHPDGFGDSNLGLETEVAVLAQKLAAKPPRSLVAARTAIHAGWSEGFKAGLESEKYEYRGLLGLDDWVEARAAAAEERPAVFTGK